MRYSLTGSYFSLGTLISSTSKTDLNDVMKGALNTRNQTQSCLISSNSNLICLMELYITFSYIIMTIVNSPPFIGTHLPYKRGGPFLRAFEIWHGKSGGLWLEGPYQRGTTVFFSYLTIAHKVNNEKLIWLRSAIEFMLLYIVHRIHFSQVFILKLKALIIFILKWHSWMLIVFY